jgi:hypothetical protein
MKIVTERKTSITNENYRGNGKYQLPNEKRQLPRNGNYHMWKIQVIVSNVRNGRV